MNFPEGLCKRGSKKQKPIAPGFCAVGSEVQPPREISPLGEICSAAPKLTAELQETGDQRLYGHEQLLLDAQEEALKGITQPRGYLFCSPFKAAWPTEGATCPPATLISSLLWSWAGGCPCSSGPHRPHWPASRCWECWANGSSPSAASGHAAAGRAPGRRPPQTRRLWQWLGSPPHFCVWFSLEQWGIGMGSLFCNPKKDRNRTTYCGEHGPHAHIAHTFRPPSFWRTQFNPKTP